jgi:hypothetical protein
MAPNLPPPGLSVRIPEEPGYYLVAYVSGASDTVQFTLWAVAEDGRAWNTHLLEYYNPQTREWHMAGTVWKVPDPVVEAMRQVAVASRRMALMAKALREFETPLAKGTSPEWAALQALNHWAFRNTKLAPTPEQLVAAWKTRNDP